MKSDFSTKLQALRAEKKVNQRQAAEDLDISQALLSHYEHGVREPRLEFIVKAGEYYGVSTDYLLGSGDSRQDNGSAAGGSAERERLKGLFSLIIAVLDDLPDGETRAAAAGYIEIAALNVFDALSGQDRLRDPMRGAALLAAEAAMLAKAGSAPGPDGQAYTYDALKERHPKAFEALSDINDKISDAVKKLRIIYDLG